MLTNTRVQEITLSLLKQQSERDSQKKIGASDFSDPCSYHLAKKLLGVPELPAKYWLGAKVGTAIHSLLEDAIDKADLSELPELEGAEVEKKIHLGELEGYGEIKSKPDFALVKDKHLIDWKTSTRDKTKKMQKTLFEEKADPAVLYTIQKYFTQVQIYAWGLNRAGIEIDGCSLVFINRDGTTDYDVWSYTFDYSEEYAVSTWNRLEEIWRSLQNDPSPEQFDRHPECFKCKVTDPAL
jgi:hypothetical protein